MENENQNEKNISNLSKSKTSKTKKTDISNNSLGKVPPQARALEEAVLGALMIDKDAVAVVVDILQSASFYEERHKSIYKAICVLFEKSHPVDLLTVTEELKKMGELEAVGGAYYLVELTNRVASAANVEFHARIIAQKFIQRELIRVSTDTINEAFEDSTDVFDLLDKAEQGLFSITEKTMSRGVLPISALMGQALKQIEELSGKEDGLTGVPSGFTNLDRLTSGWQPSDLIIMAARPGMGKCLGKGTKVIMYDGTLRAVEYIQKGDLLMGVDSRPRQVLGLGRGREQMYWIRQNKGIDYRVNESHILSLKRSRNENKHKKGQVLNISVSDFLTKTNKFQSNYKGYKVPIAFEEQSVEIEPYLLGLWLGDGNSRDLGISAIEPEIISYIQQTAETHNLNLRRSARTQGSSETHYLSAGRWAENQLRAAFVKYDLFHNKHIPQVYISNSEQNRLALLAGLLDSDGYFQADGNCFEIVQKNEQLAQQIKFLCDSLGFRTTLKKKKASIKSINFETIVYRLRLFGDLDKIPVRLPHKKAQPRISKIDWRVTGIQIEKDIVDDFYGFELDQDGLFLLEDGTVTHNTSLTLAIACNAAITFNRPCAFFSLEMSNLQLVNRILSMETQISSEKLRKGKLEEYEWQMLNNQIGRLSNVPIFIDDTPGISVFELRAKCRRLKMQHDIQIIIIDYLQLMTAGGEAGKGGNREQEISQISRSLKGLAKELNVPVIALSQLSRAVEVRGGSKRPQLSDLRECVTADTKIYLPQENQYKTVAELMQSKANFHVLALDENDLKLKQARCVDIWETGEKEIFEVQTQSGYTIRTSLNHPFKTPDGWTQLVDLKEGDFVGVARQLAHEQQDSELKDDFVKSFEEMQFIANQDTTPEKNPNLSRQRLTKIADILESPNLQKMAQSDLKWDKIVKITHIGCEMTYDLHIEEHHNFVANHFVIHNSGAIEQDADIVGFIYRPEYYGILEDEEGNSLKGIGEVIIAKHRNGALDSVRLKWDGQFAKFSNLDDNFGQDFQAFDNSQFDGGQIISSKINNEQPPNSMNYSDDVPF